MKILNESLSTLENADVSEIRTSRQLDLSVMVFTIMLIFRTRFWLPMIGCQLCEYFLYSSQNVFEHEHRDPSRLGFSHQPLILHCDASLYGMVENCISTNPCDHYFPCWSPIYVCHSRHISFYALHLTSRHSSLCIEKAVACVIVWSLCRICDI